MKAASRPQYYRIKRIVDMVREGSAEGYLPSRSDFRRELEVSPRTLARDLDFLRDEERAPIEYHARAHGYRLTEETYRLPPVRLSRKEAFSLLTCSPSHSGSTLISPSSDSAILASTERMSMSRGVSFPAEKLVETCPSIETCSAVRTAMN